MTLRGTLYGGEERDREVELDAKLVKSLSDTNLLWVDLDAIDEGRLAEVAGTLGLPEQAVGGIAERESMAEMVRFPDCIRLRLVAVQPAEPDGRRRRMPMLEMATIDIVAAQNMVVTAHEGTVAAFDAFNSSMHGDTRLGTLDAATFMAALVDQVLASYLEAVEEIERRVDALDELALRSPDPDSFLDETVAARRRVGVLRRALAPLRVALVPLGRPDVEIPELGKPWPGVLDRLERTIDAVENARELVIGSFDVYMARSAERTNDIMKTLTILNAILLPAAVVAGVMGMNFRVPFFDEPANFWFVIAAMVTLATGILAFSRWRRWI
jgi:Mg2+ and Co2+ transporter CorA